MRIFKNLFQQVGRNAETYVVQFFDKILILTQFRIPHNFNEWTPVVSAKAS